MDAHREPSPPRPPGLLYGLEDVPPLGLTLPMGLQHALTMSSTLVLPALIVQEAGGSPAVAMAFVQGSMLATGLGTVLQALPRGPIGSGYLCPSLAGSAISSAGCVAKRIPQRLEDAVGTAVVDMRIRTIEITERFREAVRPCLEHEPLMPRSEAERDGQAQLERHVESRRRWRRPIERHTGEIMEGVSARTEEADDAIQPPLAA